jgi:hypothetical protein
MTNYSIDPEHYRLALETEPALMAIETVVDLICEKGLPSQRVWSSVIKPLTLPFIGTMRGIGIDSAKNPTRPDLTQDQLVDHVLGSIENLSEKFKRLEKYRLPATTATEEWMRTSEAWDAVTRVWFQKIDEADRRRRRL